MKSYPFDTLGPAVQVIPPQQIVNETNYIYIIEEYSCGDYLQPIHALPNEETAKNMMKVVSKNAFATHKLWKIPIYPHLDLVTEIKD